MNIRKILALIAARIIFVLLFLLSRALDARTVPVEAPPREPNQYTEPVQTTTAPEETTEDVTVPTETDPLETTKETVEATIAPTAPKPKPAPKPTEPPVYYPPATQPPATQPPATQPPATQAPSDNQGGREDEFPLTPIG